MGTLLGFIRGITEPNFLKKNRLVKAELEAENKLIKNQRDEANKIVAQLYGENEYLKTQLSELSKQINSIRNDQRVTNEEKRTLLLRINEILNESDKKERDAATNLQRIKQQYAREKEELDKERAILLEDVKKLNEKNIETKETYREKVKLFEAQVKEKEKAIKEAIKERDENSEREAKLRAETGELNTQNEMKLQELYKSHEELNEQLKKKDKIIAEIEREKGALEKEKQILNDGENKLREKIKELNEASREKNKQLEQQAILNEKEKNETQKERDEYREIEAKLAAEIEELNTKNETKLQEHYKIHEELIEQLKTKDKKIAENEARIRGAVGGLPEDSKKKENGGEKSESEINDDEAKKYETNKEEKENDHQQPTEKQTIDTEPTTRKRKGKKEKSKDISSQENGKKLEQSENETGNSEELQQNNGNSQKEQDEGSQRLDDNKNTGQRRQTQFEKDDTDFEYIGTFELEKTKITKKEGSSYPDIYYPKKGTAVLKWHEMKKQATGGVSEPLLRNALRSKFETDTEIEILHNVGIRVKNREYSYRPDIALWLNKHNVIIDIEIDEPYDLKGRQPIHYIDSSDYLRNLYFIRQGWIVVRFNEEQVIKQLEDCTALIAEIIEYLEEEGDYRKSALSFNSERWTYDQAKEMEKEKYRENYLEIDEILTGRINNEDEAEERLFKGKKPEEDILPEEAESEWIHKIEAGKEKLIRVTFGEFDQQVLLKDSQIEKEKYLLRIRGINVVTEKEQFVELEKITNIEAGVDKFLVEWEGVGYENIDHILKIVRDASWNYNPIRISYTDKNEQVTERTITDVSFEGQSSEYLCDKMWERYNEGTGWKILAYCNLREDNRHFFVHQMSKIQVYNVREVGKGHIIASFDGLWYPLLKADLKMCEHILSVTPTYVKEKRAVFKVNYAHYLGSIGDKSRALKNYQEIIDKEKKKGNEIYEVLKEDFGKLVLVNEDNEKIFNEIANEMGINLN